MEIEGLNKEERECLDKFFQFIKYAMSLSTISVEDTEKAFDVFKSIYNCGYISGYNECSHRTNTGPYTPYVDRHIRTYGHGQPDGYCEEINRSSYGP